ncbi:uncharacterized protein BP5553_08355 [Venustampulla echinocandica]|uniref:Uncharacterized protein n=1 Tax=Venustampulla echinocandica TaxID=2656787 RepID=A0A370TGG1_9HELO|nr:uncharacterized protein BP5553_08355 [Venustampulla echinocandica]RDL33987.1 hypothetical protein BP5553_08355 [Venustampulla echinocandica]
MSNPHSSPIQQDSRKESTDPTSQFKPATSQESISSAPSQAAISSIALAFAEVFPPLFNVATDALVLKSQKIIAQKEFKKKREDYIKSQPNHGKFPSTEESQRRARDHAEKICKLLDEDIKAKDESLKETSTLALSKALPKIIPKLLEAVATMGNSKTSDKRYEDLEKRSLKLEQQLDEQRDRFAELKTINYKLQAQYSELQRKQREDVADLQRKQRESDAELYTSKSNSAKINEDIRHIQLRKSKDEKTAQELRRDIDSLAKSQSEVSRLQSAIPVDLQQKLLNIDKLSARIDRFEDLQHGLESKVEKIDTSLVTINICITGILEDQKKFCDFYEKFSGAAHQTPDNSEVIKAMQSQITTLDQKMENSTTLESRIAAYQQDVNTKLMAISATDTSGGLRNDITEFKDQLAKLENQLALSGGRNASPPIARAQVGEFIPDSPTPQLNDLKDQLEDLKAGQEAMGDTWAEAVDQLRDSLALRVGTLENTFATFSRVQDGKCVDLTNHCKANSLAVTNLESRYSAINTMDMFMAMGDQFGKEKFPHLEPLQATVHSMGPRIADLENVVRNRWILPPIVEERIRVVEREHQRLAELVQNVGPNANDPREASLANDLGRIQKEVSQLNQVCANRLETCTESFGEALADIRKEIKTLQGGVNQGPRKRKLPNGHGTSASPSLSVPNSPGSGSALENDRKKQRT